MAFSIGFAPDREEDARYGVIRLDDFSERFLASLEYWKEEQYERQWKDALTRILRKNTSVLITSVRDAKATSGVEWWPMYRIGNYVYFQNAIRFSAQLGQEFEPENPYDAVPSRQSSRLVEGPISEWKVPLEDVQAFSFSVHDPGQG